MLNHRIVYIDRPFQPKEVTTREKNTKFYKRAIIAMTVKPSQRGVQFTTPQMAAKSKSDTIQEPLKKQLEPSKSSGKMNPVCNVANEKADVEAEFKDSSAAVNPTTPVMGSPKISHKQDSKEQNAAEEIDKKTENSCSDETEGATVEEKEEEAEEETHIEDLESFGVAASYLSKSAKKELKMKDEDFLKMISAKRPSRQSKGFPLLSSQLSVVKKDSSAAEATGLAKEGPSLSGSEHETLSVLPKENESSYEQETSGLAEEALPKLKQVEETSKNQCSSHNTDIDNVVIEWRKPRKITSSESEVEGDSTTAKEEGVKIQGKGRMATGEGTRSRNSSTCSNDSEKLIIDDVLDEHEKFPSADVIDEAPASPESEICDRDAFSMPCRIIPIGSDYEISPFASPNKVIECPRSPERERLSPLSPESNLKKPREFKCLEIPLTRESGIEETSEVKEEKVVQEVLKPVRKPRKKMKNVKKEMTESDPDSDEHLVIDWLPESHDSSDSQSEVRTVSSQSETSFASDQSEIRTTNSARRKSARLNARNSVQNVKMEPCSIDSSNSSVIDEVVAKSHTQQVVRNGDVEDVEISKLTSSADNNMESNPNYLLNKEDIKEERESPAIQEVFQQLRRSSRGRRSTKDSPPKETEEDKKEDTAKVVDNDTKSVGSDDEISFKTKKSGSRRLTIESDSDKSDAEVEAAGSKVIQKRGRGRPRKYQAGRGRGARKISVDSVQSETYSVSSEKGNSVDDSSVVNRGVELSTEAVVGRRNSRNRASSDSRLSSSDLQDNVETSNISTPSNESKKSNQTMTRSRSKSKVKDDSQAGVLPTQALKRKSVDSAGRSSQGNETPGQDVDETGATRAMSVVEEPGSKSSTGKNEDKRYCKPSFILNEAFHFCHICQDMKYIKNGARGLVKIKSHKL